MKNLKNKQGVTDASTYIDWYILQYYVFNNVTATQTTLVTSAAAKAYYDNTLHGDWAPSSVTGASLMSLMSLRAVPAPAVEPEVVVETSEDGLTVTTTTTEKVYNDVTMTWDKRITKEKVVREPGEETTKVTTTTTVYILTFDPETLEPNMEILSEETTVAKEPNDPTPVPPVTPEPTATPVVSPEPASTAPAEPKPTPTASPEPAGTEDPDKADSGSNDNVEDDVPIVPSDNPEESPEPTESADPEETPKPTETETPDNTDNDSNDNAGDDAPAVPAEQPDSSEDTPVGEKDVSEGNTAGLDDSGGLSDIKTDASLTKEENTEKEGDDAVNLTDFENGVIAVTELLSSDSLAPEAENISPPNTSPAEAAADTPLLDTSQAVSDTGQQYTEPSELDLLLSQDESIGRTTV